MNNRRHFIKNVVTASTLMAVVPAIANAGVGHTKEIAKEVTILFQGDSITDGNRTRNTDWNHVMGHGYAYSIASKLWYENPSQGFHFLNRGVSGDKITDLEARWQADTLDLKPDWLSILVGINDTEAYVRGNQSCTTEQFETTYRSLLTQTLKVLPNIRFVLCEPFVLPVGRVKEKWELYNVEVAKRQQIVKKLAEEFNAVFIPFQSAFNEALSKAPADYWIWDGLHPMPAGHELMARLWIEKVGALA